MNLEEARKHIKTCAEQMNSRYGSVVFDEWVIVSLRHHEARILAYTGPRNDFFLQNFAKDLGTLRAGLLDPKFSVGDFEFARHGVGTGFEAFMVLGPGLYLICNHTSRTMTDIAKESKWLNAQIPFAELGNRFQGDPLSLAL
jgi:hypothetical protein